MMPITRGSLFVVTLSWMVLSAAAQGPVTPPAAPGATMKSLDQIYSEIAKLVPANPLLLPDALDSRTQGVIHMTVKGAQQGDIEGESTLKGSENSMVCLGFSHEIVSPRDPATGLATGRRQHKPIVIVKRIDKASPLLQGAMIQNENLQNVTFKFFQLQSSGSAGNQFTIKLTNANISRRTQEFPNLETLEFYYQRIEWIHVPSGNSIIDDWSTAPN
jgi:type VI secretion system secreted protein Hcp